ncbi:hypothetical protein EVAR_36332_1 [Eumeta japonica]|uniref:Uncharacterized protein n=1 Tax=Eumeta variegata TaxID=151549 RepID=A0A4C1VIG4_EUMVA|nr:hypothetical protein EVAR_36332_1 [Eumeta japonica]
MLCAAAVSFLLGRVGRWSGREIARSALSLARSVQAERDKESYFFVRAACVNRFIRHYHVKMYPRLLIELNNVLKSKIDIGDDIRIKSGTDRGPNYRTRIGIENGFTIGIQNRRRHRPTYNEEMKKSILRPREGCPTLVVYVYSEEEPASTTAKAEEEEEEEPPKRSCSIWCWIQKIAMFVISQLLSGN